MKLLDFVGKYFLLDFGYALPKGFLPPYNKVYYHFKELDEASPPMKAKELFNLQYSYLRISLERAFRVLKKRFLCVRCGAILGIRDSSEGCSCVLCVTQLSKRH